MQPMMVTKEERRVLEVARKVIWGSVEIRIEGGKIKVVKKITETIKFDE